MDQDNEFSAGADNSSSQGEDADKRTEPARNEPCPCGSGKKYKRCHGAGAAPVLNKPKMQMPDFSSMGAASGAPAGMGGFPGGFDPSQLDPAWMSQFTQALQRLPRGQMQRLQGLMQRAMSGQDISREAQEFERSLPVELQSLMRSFQMPGGETIEQAAQAVSDRPDLIPAQASLSSGAPDRSSVDQMTPDDARAIVAAALQDGKITAEQAAELIGSDAAPAPASKPSAFSKLFGGKKGK